MTNINHDYFEINRKSWNNKTAIHLQSDFYDLEAFKKGKTSLNSIELDLLRDVKNKSILHLQCHFGQDSMSLSRLGANVTGIDLSDRAIENAKSLAEELDLDTTFICTNLYDLPNHLDKKYDIVYTSYGTIGWLPDLDKWAKVVSHFLKPNGKFIFVEFHPFIWMYDNDFEDIKYRYFNSDPIIETELGSYADRKSNVSHKSISWNHGLSEVFRSLINNGLEIISFQEFDYSPYKCFNNMYEFEPNKYRIRTFEDKVPMVYSLVAEK